MVESRYTGSMKLTHELTSKVEIQSFEDRTMGSDGKAILKVDQPVLQSARRETGVSSG